MRGDQLAKQRVLQFEKDQRRAMENSDKRLAIENGALKDEMHQLRLQLSNIVQQRNILQLKVRQRGVPATARRNRQESSRPQRPSTTSGTRQKKKDHPFRPVSHSSSRSHTQSQIPYYARSSSSRLVSSPNNNYKDFKKRIDRLKQRVVSLEKQLNEEKTRTRLVNLRQLTNSAPPASNMTPLASVASPRKSRDRDRDTIDTNNHLQADELLQELISQTLLESSLHMTHDIRKEWTQQLKHNVDRLVNASAGYKDIITLVATVMKTAPFTSATTAATIATELSKLFNAQVVRIFVNTAVEDFEVEENPHRPPRSSFTFMPIAHIGKTKSTKLVKSEKICVDINGLTSSQVSAKMQQARNGKGNSRDNNSTSIPEQKNEHENKNENKNKSTHQHQHQQQSDEDEEEEEEDVLWKNSKGIGFVAGTFLRGSNICVNGDLWAHECFSTSADSTWITPGKHSLISMPVTFKQNNSVLSGAQRRGGGNTLPFAVVQLLKTTTKNNKEDNVLECFNDDSTSLLQGLLTLLAPALYSCSKPTSGRRKERRRIIVPVPVFGSQKMTRSSPNEASRMSGALATRASFRQSSQALSLSSASNSNNSSSSTTTTTTSTTNNNFEHFAELKQVTSRRIRWSAECASGDVHSAAAPGMVSFLHATTALIHCAMNSDRATLYLSDDIFGGKRIYSDDDIFFSPVARAVAPVALDTRLNMLEEGIETPDYDSDIISSLQKKIQWDSLSGKHGGMSTTPFHVHESADDKELLHETHHHHHKPRKMLRCRTDLPSYVASSHEVVRMTGASDDPVTKFGVVEIGNNGEPYTAYSILVVPIMLNEVHCIGVIELFNKHEMKGGMLSDQGFMKQDETLLVHLATELAAALSSVERQGRSQRMSETFCQLYESVVVGHHETVEEGGDVSVDTSFGRQLLSIVKVVRQLLVAEHVFIWVADNEIGGVRSYFQKRSTDLLVTTHYSHKQLLGSALGTAYFHKTSVNFRNLADVRARNLNVQESKRLYNPIVDSPNVNAQDLLVVPLLAGTKFWGILSIINVDQRELSIRNLSSDALTQYTEQVARQTATCIGCLLRMESYAQVQRQTHELLGTFARLHHSSSLRPVDLLRTSVDAVGTIFQTSNRKLTKVILVLRDNVGTNFVWARQHQTHHAASGTGAFDDMFHTFDSAKKKNKYGNSSGNGNRSHDIFSGSSGLTDEEEYIVETFPSSLNSFAAYVAQQRRPIIALRGVEDVAHDVAGHMSTPKQFLTQVDSEVSFHEESTPNATLDIEYSYIIYFYDSSLRNLHYLSFVCLFFFILYTLRVLSRFALAHRWKLMC